MQLISKSQAGSGMYLPICRTTGWGAKKRCASGPACTVTAHTHHCIQHRCSTGASCTRQAHRRGSMCLQALSLLHNQSHAQEADSGCIAGAAPASSSCVLHGDLQPFWQSFRWQRYLRDPTRSYDMVRRTASLVSCGAAEQDRHTARPEGIQSGQDGCIHLSCARLQCWHRRAHSAATLGLQTRRQSNRVRP